MRFAIFHGNERWILRGLAIDIEVALLRLGHSVNRIESSLTNPDPPPEADFYLFVQQGQLNLIHKAWGYKTSLLSKSLCIFTHYDNNNAKIDVLNKILLVLHMSTQQMATAIANGLSASISYYCPLGFDPQRHYPLKSQYLFSSLSQIYPPLAEFPKRHFIGFCTRYSTKSTYTRRKDYSLLFDVINNLASENLPLLIIGDGWEKVDIKRQSTNVLIYDPPYQHYNLFYNMMKIFCSVTSYDGGPIPLLESMSAGVYPVITNSGFAPDVIQKQEVGSLFQPFSDPQHICQLIKAAYNKDVDKQQVNQAIANFSFDSFDSKMVDKLHHLVSN